MTRTRYYWDKARGAFVLPEEWAPPRSSGPSVVTDSMDAIRSEADGRVYDSKSAYRKGLKRAGCIEIGSEPIHEAAPRAIPDVPGLRDEIRKTWSEMNG